MKSKSDMLSGNAMKSILLFSLPIMLSSLLQYNYSLVDNIIVGRYVSTDALAAVGNVGAINSFIIGAALGLTGGFTIPVAQAFGAGDKKRLNKYAGSSITVAVLVGVVIVVAAHIVSRPLLRLIGTPDEIIDLSASYVNVLYLGVPFQMLSNNFTAVSRAVGESKKPLYFFLVSVVVNFILDVLFVKYFDWGVKGAAWATLISELTAAVLTGIYVLRFNRDINIKRSDLAFDKKTAWQQIKLGIPVSLQFTITSIGSMCLQSAVNSFGANVMAGFTAAGRVENLTNIPMSGLGVANQTFVGQNYGAKKMDRVHRGVRTSMIMAFLMTGLMVVFMWFIGDTLISLFTTDTAVREICHGLIHFLVPTFFTYISIEILSGALRGVGDAWIPMFITGIGICGVRIVWMTAVLPHFHSLKGAAFCYPLSWVITTIAYFIYYLFFSQLSKRKELRSI